MEKARGGMEAENDSLQWEVFYQVISSRLSCNQLHNSFEKYIAAYYFLANFTLQSEENK